MEYNKKEYNKKPSSLIIDDNSIMKNRYLELLKEINQLSEKNDYREENRAETPRSI